jgi:sugar diacid utilization regulator
MDWERIKNKLEPILKAPIKGHKLPAEEWNKLADAQSDSSKTCKSVLVHGQIYFYLETLAGIVYVLEVEEALLTHVEKHLIELMLEAHRIPEKAKAIHSSVSEEERSAHSIKDWVDLQLAMRVNDAIMPESLVTLFPLQTTQVPLLLSGGHSDSKHVHYKELKKLLESFFEAEIILIPLLEKEWLILGADTLLTASEGEDKESEEDALSSICSGLHEMLANEWLGECHLSIHYPLLSPAKSLLNVIVEMRETMRLGKLFYPGVNIHLPWKIHLEKLVNGLPEPVKQQFVTQVLKRSDQLPDTEMYATLEQFFIHDCNVSETAKKLYIHRNTLLYRLDKFNQETGLDVRCFSDAVLVKVALLLYKVTKRI